MKPAKCPEITSSTASSATRTPGRVSSSPSTRRSGLSLGGSAGSVATCVASVTRLSAPAATKALRQPQTSPIQAPSGAAQTVATDTPARITDIARANRRSGTSRIASAAAIDQKPPSATPRITRAASSTPSEDAVTASRLDSTSSSVSATMTARRSKRRVSSGMDGAATAPTSAVAVTVWPAAPALMPRSAAIAVSRLAGRNSAVTRPKTPSVSEAMALQWA